MMKDKNQSGHPNKSTKTPLWKWLLIGLLILAMPLFFSFVRNARIQQALVMAPAEQNTPTLEKSTQIQP
jgi:hypothetical protein